MIRVVCLLIGYALGSVQTAYILGRIKGIDIRQHGSGNAGTTNTLRVLGTKAGLIVFVGDLMKSIIAILLTRALFAAKYADIAPLISIYTGAGCVLGHNFPFYLKFKGGKGIATTGGLMIAFHWLYIPFGLLVFFGNFFITHIVSIGSLLLYLLFFAETIVIGQMGIFGVAQSVLNELYVIVFLLTVLAFYMHRANIKRLLTGTERKTYLLKKNKMDIETNSDARSYKGEGEDNK